MSEASAGSRWSTAVVPAFRRCLRSLLNQTNKDISIQVGCHDIPAVDSDTRVHFRVADFPVPARMDRETYERISGKPIPKLPDVKRRAVGDKYSKIKLGLIAAFDDPECKAVMFVDADDLVHCDVAGYTVANLPKSPGGFTVTRGYSYQVGSGVLNKVDGFYGVCGTCNVIALTERDREVFSARRSLHDFDRSTHWLFAGHASVFKRIRKAGLPTTKFPFRAAVYVTGHGANISGTKKTGGSSVAITPDLTRAFGGAFE